ncbi:MAG: STAS domain-containing protein [Labedaea sp.]
MPEAMQPYDELSLTSSRPADGCVVLTVTGEVDLLTTPGLDAEITKQLSGNPPSTLVLDLTGVVFFGSSGLAALIRAATVAQERGVRLLLVASGRAVLRPLEVTTTASLFDVHATVDAALAASDRAV